MIDHSQPEYRYFPPPRKYRNQRWTSIPFLTADWTLTNPYGSPKKITISFNREDPIISIPKCGDDILGLTNSGFYTDRVPDKQAMANISNPAYKGSDPNQYGVDSEIFYKSKLIIPDPGTGEEPYTQLIPIDYSCPYYFPFLNHTACRGEFLLYKTEGIDEDGPFYAVGDEEIRDFCQIGIYPGLLELTELSETSFKLTAPVSTSIVYFRNPWEYEPIADGELTLNWSTVVQ